MKGHARVDIEPVGGDGGVGLALVEEEGPEGGVVEVAAVVARGELGRDANLEGSETGTMGNMDTDVRLQWEWTCGDTGNIITERVEVEGGRVAGGSETRDGDGI
jgi:hypothetical protein